MASRDHLLPLFQKGLPAACHMVASHDSSLKDVVEKFSEIAHDFAAFWKEELTPRADFGTIAHGTASTCLDANEKEIYGPPTCCGEAARSSPPQSA